MKGYEDFLKAEQEILKSMSCSACSDWRSLNSLSTMVGLPIPYPRTTYATDFSITIPNAFDTIGFNKEKDMMTLFNWFLVSKFEEGKEPIKSGFITSVDEESAREFIVRLLDKEIFEQYKDGEFALVVTEVDSWEL